MKIISIFYFYSRSVSIVQGTRVLQPQLFLLDQPLCSLYYKMCACHRIHNQRRKSTGEGAIFARRTDNHNYGQDRDGRHSDNYWYNSDYVQMFDSVRIIKLDASQNRSLAGVGKATSKKILWAFKGGQYKKSLVQKNKK